MRESELQANIVEYVGYLPTVRIYHTYDSRRSNPGWMDLVIAGRRGVLFRELKSTKGKVTEDQAWWLRTLRECGMNTGVWRPADWPERITAEIGEIR